MIFTLNIPEKVSPSDAFNIYKQLKIHFNAKLDVKEMEIIELNAQVKTHVKAHLQLWEHMKNKLYTEQKKNKELKLRIAELEVRNAELQAKN
jgi:hypothetical protein